MMDFNQWVNSQKTESPNQLPFDQWVASQKPAEPLSMPEFTWDGYQGDSFDKQAFLTDYLGDLNNYGTTLNDFSTANAGKMISINPTAIRSIEDFGWGTGRGDLQGEIDHGYYIGDNLLHDNNFVDLFAEYDPNDQSERTSYFKQVAPGEYQQVYGTGYGGLRGAEDGTELFTRSGDYDPSAWGSYEYGPTAKPFEYTSAGNYRAETPEEAAKRLTDSTSGASATGGRNDFMGEMTLADMQVDHSGKWGKDYVNMPELKQYLDDQSWVQRDKDGNITSVRAELLPLMFSEDIGEEARNLNRGVTDESDFLGSLIPTLILGLATAGIGTAAASAMGMTTAGTATGLSGALLPAGTALTGTGALTAGTIGGGLNSAIQGEDIGKGVLTGVLTGGLNQVASPYISNTLGGMGITNKWLNDAITGGTIGSLKSGLTGGNPVTGFGTGMVNSVGTRLGNQYFGPESSFLKDAAVNMGTGAVNSAITGRQFDPTNAIMGAGMKTFDQWLAGQMKG